MGKLLLLIAIVGSTIYLFFGSSEDPASPVVVSAPIPEETTPARTYAEDDLGWWDSAAVPYKPQIVAAVNRIASENSRCTSIDTNSIALSTSRSSPGDPVFFVTCMRGSDAFNVWFRPSDGDSDGASFAAIRPIERSAAIDACEGAARNEATHPSTVAFSRIMDVAYSTNAAGRASVDSTFTARNSFDLEVEYQIRCLFEGADLIDATIMER